MNDKTLCSKVKEESEHFTLNVKLINEQFSTIYEQRTCRLILLYTIINKFKLDVKKQTLISLWKIV